MSTPVDEIVRLYHERVAQQGPFVSLMRDLTAAYEGTVAVPLPELDKQEKVAVANLIALGLDQNAMRISSVLPDVFYYPTRPGQPLAEKRSRLSRQANVGWWKRSNMELKLARRARWLIGYSCSPVMVEWDTDLELPVWRLRSPMGTFPSQGDDPDEINPENCIFVYRRQFRWLENRYPSAMLRLSKGGDNQPDTFYDVLEYVDDVERVLVVLGRARDSRDRVGAYGVSQAEQLGDRLPNRCGCPGVFVPGRITLNRRQGAYDGMIGLYQQQAKLMALEVIAVTRGVFPNEWAVSRPNESATIVNMANGRRGIVGKVEGGEIVPIQVQPGYQTPQTIDRLERYMRMNGGVPAEFGGESATNVRTGRRGDAILSATVDFPVQEAQKILSRSMELENQCAMAQAKAYAGSRPVSFFVPFRTEDDPRTYVADRDFPTSDNRVSWPVQGTDEQQLIVGIGQRLGVGELSLYTARRMDPWCEDPQFEEEKVAAEKLDAALLNSVAQGLAGDPASIARIQKMLVEGRVPLADAVLAVHDQKQTEQAVSGPPGSPEGPVQPGAPAAQPGLAQPGAPPQAGMIGPQPNQEGLASLLAALRKGAQGVPA